MKLISFECRGTGSIGVLEDNIVVDLGELLCEIGEVESMVDDLLPIIEAEAGKRLASVDMRSVLETGRYRTVFEEVSLSAFDTVTVAIEGHPVQELLPDTSGYESIPVPDVHQDLNIKPRIPAMARRQTTDTAWSTPHALPRHRSEPGHHGRHRQPCRL